MASERMQEPDGSEEVESSKSGSGDDSGSEDSNPVVTLVAGKEKRATAGNRMTSLLEREEDDEVALLFAEADDEDEEFAGDEDEDASDAHLDSSSDDDDQGPNYKGDEALEGETELKLQEKAEKAKKRKADMAFTTGAGLRKKLRPDATAAAPKPSKKKDRQTWLRDEKDGPSRTSSRWQTMANREVTQARIKETEKKRAKTMQQLRRAEREREKHKPKELTQADRLAEAEKTERKNAKSLNRWEAMEKKRVEEQAAKLAALHNRKLEGPVVSWWSGVAQWVGPRLTRVGSKETNIEPPTEGKKRGRKPKHYYEALEAAKEREADHSSMGTPRDQTTTPAPSETAATPGEGVLAASEAHSPQITFAAPQGLDNFLTGIQEYASLPSEAGLNHPAGSQTIPSESLQTPTDPIQQPSTQTTVIPPLPPVEHSTRNILVLENFDNLSPQDRGDFTLFYSNRKTPKPSKQNQELCTITSLPARHRDPSTEIPYANAFAYKKLQELQKHQYRWSSMLGCYVGAVGVAARGVPDGFATA